ncbi:fructose-6-phosphate aldolase [Halodesulfovibrio marinisediminis]|uniref:Probable transaldolase n=1 Tax=Halodesulfovibrio marinisediminis DSM 17456 TaxID=1121457 RepID=A0A1N6DN44_9BACT|nr:fructose-6-phosphate aldolase [Halodesulfovibrio marinisediminis]SIN72195.1 transaldolase [Halodesulfovibrio marinisediminis DSM 17456]
MRFFIDTAKIEDIRTAADQGLIDGVTTNPTLLSREGGDWRDRAKEILEVVKGPVSLEVVAEDAAGMILQAHDLKKMGDNVVVKIPMTPEGLKAVKTLSSEGIDTNVTLIFSPLQALLAAKAGGTYVSPFIGRLDAIAENGMSLVEDIRTIFDNYGFTAKILVASVRHPMHVLEAALIGADVATVPFAVLQQFVHHPLTDKGLASFLGDWKKLTGGKW